MNINGINKNSREFYTEKKRKLKFIKSTQIVIVAKTYPPPLALFAIALALGLASIINILCDWALASIIS